MTEPKREEWEERFHEKFFRFQEMGAIENSDEIIPFIRAEIEKALKKRDAEWMESTRLNRRVAQMEILTRLEAKAKEDGWYFHERHSLTALVERLTKETKGE